MALNYTQAWLEDQTSIKGIFVEVGVKDIAGAYGASGAEATLYLSNLGYTTSDASISFLPYLSGQLQTTESLSFDNSLSLSFGDLEIANPNGELDDWLDSSKFIWVNRPIKIYLGDPRWVLANLPAIRDTANGGFEKIFDGVVADIDSGAREVLNLKIRDKLQRLNEPVSDSILGTYGTWSGGQSNQDTIRPIILGEVNNISPILVDPSTLEYMFHDTNVGAYVTSTSSGTNLISCNSTSGFTLNALAKFSGDMLGGLLCTNNYYIKTINSDKTFTVSSTPGGAVVASTSGTTTPTGRLLVQVNVGSTESVIEIRDNGFPIYTNPAFYTGSTARPDNAIIDLNAGKFKLKSSTSGTITASIQGTTTSIDLATGQYTSSYTNGIAQLVAVLVTKYGPSNTRLAISDIDLVNFLAFAQNSNNIPTAVVGYAALDRTNILAACQDILASCNAQLFMNRKGLLQLIQLGVYTSDPVVSIYDYNIVQHSLRVVNRPEVVAATKIGYCRNYTVQTSLAASLPSAHNVMFGTEWYTTTVVDSQVQSDYKTDVSPTQKNTALLTSSAANSLATRLNNYYKIPKTVYGFTADASMLSLKLGQQVVLYHNRFGLSSGKSGQVVSLTPNWISGSIEVEVII